MWLTFFRCLQQNFHNKKLSFPSLILTFFKKNKWVRDIQNDTFCFSCYAFYNIHVSYESYPIITFTENVKFRFLKNYPILNSKSTWFHCLWVLNFQEQQRCPWDLSLIWWRFRNLNGSTYIWVLRIQFINLFQFFFTKFLQEFTWIHQSSKVYNLTGSYASWWSGSGRWTRLFPDPELKNHLKLSMRRGRS
jgi:hypothetical protein